MHTFGVPASEDWSEFIAESSGAHTVTVDVP
jgi:hypothetical protein